MRKRKRLTSRSCTCMLDGMLFDVVDTSRLEFQLHIVFEVLCVRVALQNNKQNDEIYLDIYNIISYHIIGDKE